MNTLQAIKDLLNRGFEDLGYIGVIITGVVIFLLTLLVSSFVSGALKSFLKRDETRLPAMSIYINISRFIIWTLGISFICYFCFNIDISGIIAAMGITGIAISLGFKDTLSNLISGIQISSMKLMEPGDHVMIANLTGTVIDTTWRHTELENMDGEVIVVPNSVINSTAIIKKTPYSNVRVNVHIHAKSRTLSALSNEITDVVYETVSKIIPIKGKVTITFSSVSDTGAKGILSFSTIQNINREQIIVVKDATVRAIAPYIEAAKE